MTSMDRLLNGRLADLADTAAADGWPIAAHDTVDHLTALVGIAGWKDTARLLDYLRADLGSAFGHFDVDEVLCILSDEDALADHRRRLRQGDAD
jgi:hypothetical protein